MENVTESSRRFTGTLILLIIVAVFLILFDKMFREEVNIVTEDVIDASQQDCMDTPDETNDAGETIHGCGQK